jgi:dTDP-4-amino-4,6-dideoxygalactose transaminase
MGSQYRAMTVAAEILIAQLHSQSKLTKARHKNRKFYTETNF